MSPFDFMLMMTFCKDEWGWKQTDAGMEVRVCGRGWDGSEVWEDGWGWDQKSYSRADL